MSNQTYESWRLGFQSSEQAAKSAFDDASRLASVVEQTARQLGVVTAQRDLASEHLSEVLDALEELISSLDSLILQSDGVFGLHLNGDLAPWVDLLKGGSHEDWLKSLSDSTEVLHKFRGERHD